MKKISEKAQFCVVGGGLSGLCAAVAAARHGAKTILIHDRPVLGGNASSEIRVPIMGAHGSWDRSVRETGIIEELMLESLYRNPFGNWQMWSLAMHVLAKNEPNLSLHMNCSCTEAFAQDGRLQSLRAWQSTTQTWIEVEAELFADCSGDSILSSFCGAEMREGREASSEFGESTAPEVATKNKLGMSLMFIWRDMASPQRFMPPTWIHAYHSEEAAPFHSDKINLKPVHGMNCFFVELGGDADTIHDSERIKDDLLKMGLGLIDHYKNHGDHDAENLTLEWFGFLPGKRESLRYVGDHILTQADVQKANEFEDIVAYGGWPIDDHDSKGSHRKGKGTHDWYEMHCPYGIPLRSLYSKDVDNLMMAGRNISASHMALCSTRVMATCSVMGQAVGTAAALATRYACSPREVGRTHLLELQSLLQDDDCWLPGKARQIPEFTQNAAIAASVGVPDALRDGHDREDEDNDLLHAWESRVGDWVEYRVSEPMQLRQSRIVFDSHLKRKWFNMPMWYPRDGWDLKPPQTMVKSFSLEIEKDDGTWESVYRETNNFQRLVRVPLNVTTSAIRLIVHETWGDESVKIFAWDVSD